MNQHKTTAIILTRVDYGEADRIVTVLTPDSGKLSLMAKGVRRVKSKLAGGIELFSTSEITYLPGKGSVGTLISTRLIQHYGNAVHDIDRLQLGYALIKLLNKITEEDAGEEYFTLLHRMLQGLDDLAIENELIQLWFYSQLLRIGGMTPNLSADTTGAKLDAAQTYQFDFDRGMFTPTEGGPFGVNHIKLLRLLFSDIQPQVLAKVQSVDALIQVVKPIVLYWQQSYSS